MNVKKVWLTAHSTAPTRRGHMSAAVTRVIHWVATRRNVSVSTVWSCLSAHWDHLSAQWGHLSEQWGHLSVRWGHVIVLTGVIKGIPFSPSLSLVVSATYMEHKVTQWFTCTCDHIFYLPLDSVNSDFLLFMTGVCAAGHPSSKLRRGKRMRSGCMLV